MHECFGAGTAAVVSPINLFHYGGRDYSIPLVRDDPDAQIGRLTKRVWDELTGIQYGAAPDPAGWSVPVDDA